MTSQTRLVQFNDVDALQRELQRGDVACVVTEPALTNLGVIQPDPEFHEALRALTRETGTVLILDETPQGGPAQVPEGQRRIAGG